jgi:hypothetical protein
MDTLLITLISLFSNIICQIHTLFKINNLFTFVWSLITKCDTFFFLFSIVEICLLNIKMQRTIPIH